MPLHDPTCLFCKIIAGEIPSAKILETDTVFVFLDINPVNHGHLLLVPKSHHPSIAELSDEDAASTARLLPRLSRALVEATGAHGLNIIVNNGRAAGQTIPHGHWHLIPRFVDDAVNWPWPHSAYDGDELAEMQSRITHGLTIEENSRGG